MERAELCPLCAGPATPWLTVRQSPILLNSQLPTRAEALAVERVDVRLWHCPACCFAFNPDYREEAVDYAATANYNSNQLASPAHRRYVAEVVDLVARKAALHAGSRVLEVACGSGYFLSQLMDRAGCHKVAGYDPQYRGEHGMESHIRRRVFTEAEGCFDLVVIRHALDQLVQAGAVLRAVRSVMAQGARLYVEGLNLVHAARTADIAQFSHERASYFSVTALARLLSNHGLAVTEAFPLALGDYMGVLAEALPAASALEEALRRLDAIVARHQKVIVWGIGARAVSVMTQLNWDEGRVAFGVDVDPMKQGRFVPVTGQRILSPSEALALRPDLVVVANAYYLGEIQATFPYSCSFLTLDGVLTPSSFPRT